MDLTISKAARNILTEVSAMVRDDIMPLDHEYLSEVGKAGDRFAFTARQTEILEGLKAKARARGLWNLWRTRALTGAGPDALSTVEYAHLAEEMGRAHLGAEVFNCSAPDTGNMDVLARFGSTDHQHRWLEPLLAGKIRSAYLMTEPAVASSDATNIALSMVRDGDHYVLNGEKYWASGAGDPRCALYIVMALTDPDGPKHRRHSQILVDPKTPGIQILRPMQIFGHDDAPHGHMHVRFNDVRVPVENLLQTEGDGFLIAQGRLGPGRIHHCMRLIGQAERALELMCQRALDRSAFGKALADLGANHDIIAESRIAIEQARLLCLKAAWMMDTAGPKEAAVWVSQIKVVAPRMAQQVIDDAMQIFGATGISQDTPLAHMWMNARMLRFADGPDAVHRRVIGRSELAKHQNG